MKHIHQHGPGMAEGKTRGVRPWALTWDPRFKTAAAVCFVFGLISLDNLWLLGASLVFLMGAALVMRISSKVLFLRLALLLPFLGFMSIPIILGGGFPIPPDRLFLAARIFLKAFTSMVAMVLLLNTQPIEEYLQGLTHMKVPSVFTTILFLAYRYVYLFVEELKSMQKSLASRLFRSGLNKQTLNVYGELSGVMLIKSLDRSETVYRAMASRCFNGQLPLDTSPVITPGDIVKFLVPVSFMVSMIILEQVVI